LQIQLPNEQNDKLLTPNEVSVLLNVSLHTVYYWVERNEIPFFRVGRQRY
jgi:excisionase family DNA binding protein